MAGASKYASLGEEEILNLFFMVFILPAGLLMRAVIYFILGVWALMHVAIMCDA